MGALIKHSCITARRANPKARIAYVIFQDHEWRMAWSELDGLIIGLANSLVGGLASKERDLVWQCIPNTEHGIPVLDLETLISKCQQEHISRNRIMAIIRHILGFEEAEVIRQSIGEVEYYESAPGILEQSRRVRESSIFDKDK